MPVRKATPEETQAFWAKPVVVFGQMRPESQKAPQPTAPVSEEDPKWVKPWASNYV